MEEFCRNTEVGRSFPGGKSKIYVGTIKVGIVGTVEGGKEYSARFFFLFSFLWSAEAAV